MINCGGAVVEQRDSRPDYDDGTWTWQDGSAARDATISAMLRVFPEVLLCDLFHENPSAFYHSNHTI